MGPLTNVEAARLRELEGVILPGLKRFLQVGAALAEIHAKRLYRSSYANFNAYCQARLKIGAQQARRWALAAEASADAAPEGSGLPPPQRLAQAEALASIPVEERQPTWEIAVREAGGGQPATSRIEELARKVASGLKGASLARLVDLEDKNALRLDNRSRELDAESEGKRLRLRARESLRIAAKHADDAGYKVAADAVRGLILTLDQPMRAAA